MSSGTKRRWSVSDDEEKPTSQTSKHQVDNHHHAPSSFSSKKSNNTGGSKGLREYSNLVHLKLQEKIHTSYNEVADELVKDLLHSSKDKENYHNSSTNDEGDLSDSSEQKASKLRKGNLEEKNIRRRVYDALNVLMAIGMITKDKKKITWKGLPSNSDDLKLEHERDQLLEEIERKNKRLQSLLVQNICFQNLSDRNEDALNRHNKYLQKPESGDIHQHHYLDTEKSKVHFPFVVLKSSLKASIHCFDVDHHRNRSKIINFNQPFEIHPDMLVFDQMGLHRTTLRRLEEIVAPHIVQYCEEQNFLKDILMNEYTGSTKEDKPKMAGESIQSSKKSPTDIHHYSQQRPPVSRPPVASHPYWHRRHPHHQRDDTPCQFPTIHSSDNSMRHAQNYRQSTWAPPPPHPHSTSYYPSHSNS